MILKGRHMNIFDHKNAHIHFIGIGGISMRGLALMMLEKNYNVTGSDMVKSSCFEKLEKAGAKCYSPHKRGQETGADFVIINSAIPDDNPELVAAREKNIPIVQRIELIGQMMESARIAFGVSGMHGKTTCSSMLVTILELCGMNPTVNLGGSLDIIEGTAKWGGDIFIAEACEYKNNYHQLPLDGAIILNIEEDHLDFFEDLDAIFDSYKTYINNLPKDGMVFLNADDVNTIHCGDARQCKAITFGIENEADYKGIDLEYDEFGCYSFTLLYDNKKYKVKLSVPGRHNVYNALAAIGAAYYLGTDIECASEKISLFHGAKRRFEHIRDVDGIGIYHDYAHHPTEVKATLNTAGIRCKGKVNCIFQPHLYSRTRDLLNDFAKALSIAENIIIVDIYAAREIDTGDIHSKDLVKEINDIGEKYCVYAPDFAAAAKLALELSNKGDMIITLGAGSIEDISDLLVCSS